MRTIELDLPGGGRLTGLLRTPEPHMPDYTTRPAVLIIPGGGYDHVSGREADPAALQFAAAGYHVFVLNYAVGTAAQNYLPLRQTEAALAAIRANFAQWNIIPNKVAVCGFSAGGHLALSSAVLDLPGHTGTQNRPNAVILAYPVVSAGQYAHRGSFAMLTGSNDPADHAAFSLEDKITPQMPPVFLWHCTGDTTVPVENSLMLAAALQKAGVPYEAHLFAGGRHGISICTAEVGTPEPRAAEWLPLALDWLADRFAFHQ